MPKGDHGGSASGGGHDFQSDVFAYVACHALSEHPLSWFDDYGDVPLAISMETGGPGDDLQIELNNSKYIELQVKKGIRKGDKLWDALLKLINGLQTDQNLRAVLFVDGTSSGTVKNDLRTDVKRLAGGRRDGLKPIGQEFIAKLAVEKITDFSLLQRLQIVVSDLYEGSDGCAAAMALLRTVIHLPKATPTAWEILAKDGLRNTRDRGRSDCSRLLGILRRHVELTEKSNNHAVILEQYRFWMTETKASFFVPVLGIALPVTSAWNRLRFIEEVEGEKASTREALARQIAAYHEWEKLADKRYSGDCLSTEALLLQSQRSVIIGGPGAGKSTLLFRLACWAANENKIVLHVSLRTINQIIKTGKTFEESIVIASCDGSG
ncbi:MAG: hypothetical protein KAU94_01145, partial [Verrucomicrobia bacterium]|nr:hypothetical protein [Verrucomicrobiota bacterium]